MTLGETLGLADRQERLIARSMQLALLAMLVYGLVTVRLGMVSNAGLALAATLIPAVLRREYGYTMDAGLVAWITAAVFLHSVGALGPYDWFQWYDEVTHTMSATVIAGVGYAVFRAVEIHSDDIDVPSAFRAVFVVVFVLATGVIWEIAEFASGGLAILIGIQKPLVVYGIVDIVTDFVFNAVGALAVAVWGTGYFGGLVSFFRHRIGS